MFGKKREISEFAKMLMKFTPTMVHVLNRATERSAMARDFILESEKLFSDIQDRRIHRVTTKTLRTIMQRRTST